MEGGIPNPPVMKTQGTDNPLEEAKTKYIIDNPGPFSTWIPDLPFKDNKRYTGKLLRAVLVDLDTFPAIHFDKCQTALSKQGEVCYTQHPMHYKTVQTFLVPAPQCKKAWTPPPLPLLTSDTKRVTQKVICDSEGKVNFYPRKVKVTAENFQSAFKGKSQHRNPFLLLRRGQTSPDRAVQTYGKDEQQLDKQGVLFKESKEFLKLAKSRIGHRYLSLARANGVQPYRPKKMRKLEDRTIRKMKKGIYPHVTHMTNIFGNNLG